VIDAFFGTLASLAAPWVLAGCTLVVFVAYVLRGATGFGAGVVAIPLLVLAMPLNVVIPVITTLGILASFGQSVQEFRHVDWRALRALALPSAVGVSLGLWLFASLDQRLLRPGLSRGALAATAGGTGGLVATLFGGMAGPFYAIYLKALALDKQRFRASISSVLLCLGLVRAGGYGSLGFYDRRALALMVLLAPVMVLAMLAGDRWHARLDQARFERVVSFLLAASGVALLLK